LLPDCKSHFRACCDTKAVDRLRKTNEATTVPIASATNTYNIDLFHGKKWRWYDTKSDECESLETKFEASKTNNRQRQNRMKDKADQCHLPERFGLDGRRFKFFGEKSVDVFILQFHAIDCSTKLDDFTIGFATKLSLVGELSLDL
jgi:hypothetical protein